MLSLTLSVFSSCFVFFFFSSRRRHTRLQGDWSSDVCSSDLGGIGGGRRGPLRRIAWVHPRATHGLFVELRHRERYDSLSGGRRSAHGCALSNAAAARRTPASSRQRPTICTPTGRPDFVKPAGTEIAGRPT